MHIQFLGTGGAFDYQLGNSAAWIEFRGHRILLDCGSTVYPRLRESGLIHEIDYILITHCHDDHVGTLSTLLLHHAYNRPIPHRPVILAPTLSFRNHLYQLLSFSIPVPEDFVKFAPIYELRGLEAIDTFGLHVPGMPTFGFCFEDEKEIVIYSGDLGDPRPVFELAERKKRHGKPIRIFHEMSFEPSNGVHTHYQELAPWLDQYEIYAYHLNPADAPADNRVPLVIDQPHLIWMP